MASRSYKPFSHVCEQRLENGKTCNRGFRNRSGLTQHVNAKHRPFAPINDALPSFNHDANPSPLEGGDFPPEQGFDDHEAADQGQTESDVPPTRVRRIEKHPILDGTPCDVLGRDLPPGTPPPRHGTPVPGEEFHPFDDRADFTLAEFFYTRNQTPAVQIDTLMDIWAAKHSDTGPPFADHKDLYKTIDDIKLGDAPWKSFAVSYAGELPDDEDSEVPPWMTAEYEVWYRDPLTILENQLANPDFKDSFHEAPFRETNDDGEHVWSDVMSGNWAWKQADTIAESSESTHGAMFVPVILGSDKTTVSVATGQNEYYPLYVSNGVVTNGSRRAHKNAVSLLGFLAIPKTNRKYANDDQFRKFRRQLFHGSIRAILEPLRDAMSEPRVTKCPDGHFRRVIYGIGPYIADYPEQCIIASIVSDWCPRCTGTPDNLDGPSLPRTKAYTELLIKYLDLKTLWQDYGIAAEAEPFTSTFPRADIYELVTSDLLHQVIKGTFKDHLVTWVGEWLEMEHGKTKAAAIMADIDRRIAAVPSFPGLRRFPEGRGFKQWTGNDSKALMKVYLPAIVDHVPEQMVRTLAAFLDFCYLVRRSSHTETTLQQINHALAKFHKERVIFEQLGVRPTGLSVPRQHSLSHYVEVIQLFGSPNGLCSSITESKHIKAVKEPYRRTNHYRPLGQMLVINQRLDKLAALRASLEAQGLLSQPLLVVSSPQETPTIPDARPGQDTNGENEAVEGPRRVDNDVFLALTPVRGYPRRLELLANHLEIPSFPTLVGRFLYTQLYPNSTRLTRSIPLHQLPEPDPRSIRIFHSAVAKFYAPSDYSGQNGRMRERIRSTPSWQKAGPRRDCILVTQDPDEKGMARMEVARAILFFSFTYQRHSLPCVLVEWFTTRRQPCPRTGMFITERDYGRNGSRALEVIHIDAVVRGVHLIPLYGEDLVPYNISYTNSLDHYNTFFVNKYADHHSNELIF